MSSPARRLWALRASGDLNGADPFGEKLLERSSQSTCHPVDLILEVMVARVAPLIVSVRSHEVFKAADDMVGVQVGESHLQISPAFTSRHIVLNPVIDVAIMGSNIGPEMPVSGGQAVVQIEPVTDDIEGLGEHACDRIEQSPTVLPRSGRLPRWPGYRSSYIFATAHLGTVAGARVLWVVFADFEQ